MMVERFKDYFLNANSHDDMRKKLPDHVLFSRDGVSESQFGMVRSEEIPQIEQAIKDVKAELIDSKENQGWHDIAKSWEPKITLLVVGKRHHGRFFSVTPVRAMRSFILHPLSHHVPSPATHS